VLALAGERATLYGMAVCSVALSIWMLAAPAIRQIGIPAELGTGRSEW
jgi:hypothetical protein